MRTLLMKVTLRTIRQSLYCFTYYVKLKLHLMSRHLPLVTRQQADIHSHYCIAAIGEAYKHGRLSVNQNIDNNVITLEYLSTCMFISVFDKNLRGYKYILF